MRKVFGMLCACLLLVSSIGTGVQVQAENRVVKKEQTEMETRDLFCYEALEGSHRGSVVKADSEKGWLRESVPETEIDETSRLIYDGPVNVRITLPEEKNNYENYVVTVWHNGTELWHASVEKEETLDFICQISGWEWQEETQSYELQVSCFAEGDYQIAIEKIMKTDRNDEGEEKSDDEVVENEPDRKPGEGDIKVNEGKTGEEKQKADKKHVENNKSDSGEMKLLGKSATVTVDRTSPEAYLSWRKNEMPSGDTTAVGTQFVELAIRDANFRPSEVEWRVLAKRIESEETDSEKYWTDATASSLKKWSDWERDKQEPDLWHAVVVLSSDGNYQMELNYTDLAGHSLQKTCMGALAIDTVSPLLSVDCPTPLQRHNGKAYYAEKTEMILTVTEVNFRPEEFVISMTRNGVAEEAQMEWKRTGAGEYQCALSLEKDGEYEIQASYKDPYGNEMEPYHSEKIVIDRTAPEIKVYGIHADTAGKATISDAILCVRDVGDNLNPETMQPMLKRVVVGEDGKYLTEEVLLPTPAKDSDAGVWKYRIPELTEDGIYTLTCQAEDYSGNKITEIKTEDGTLHQKVKFSINRRGSTFEVDDTVIELADRYYIYMVESDVEIREVNTDLIEQYAVRLNGAVLQEGKDYTTDATAEDGNWSMRRYVVKKELFAKEGEYHLVVESQDKTGTRAYSDMKQLRLSWVIDQSAPIVLLAGLKADYVYETEKQQVTAVPSDEGGKLKTFQVSLLDALGENRQMLVNLTGEKLEQYLKEHNGQVQFTIPEGVEQQVEILCDDQAWKRDGSTNEYHKVITGVSVAKNQRSLRRMKKDLEKKLRDGAEQAESDSNRKVQKKKSGLPVLAVTAAVGVVCCVAVIGGRRKKKQEREKRTHN